MYIQEHGGKVCIRSARSRIELELDRTGDLRIYNQGFSGKEEYIIPSQQCGIIIRAADLAGSWFGQEWVGAGRIVTELIGRFGRRRQDGEVPIAKTAVGAPV